MRKRAALDVCVRDCVTLGDWVTLGLRLRVCVTLGLAVGDRVWLWLGVPVADALWLWVLDTLCVCVNDGEVD